MSDELNLAHTALADSSRLGLATVVQAATFALSAMIASGFVDGGLNPRLSGGGAETGTNFAAELLADRVRGDRFLSTPQAAGGGGQRPAFTGIYRPAKIGRRDRWRCSIASSPTQNIQRSGRQAAG